MPLNLFTISRIIILFFLTHSANFIYAQTETNSSLTKDLADNINSMDLLLFQAIFEDCNVMALNDLATEDVEFYHDKWGIIASSRTELIKNISAGCEARSSGRDNKAKRELDPGSVEIHQIAGYGAIHKGRHLFYQFINDQYTFTESGQFTHLWKNTPEGWKIARILSYDHKPTKQ